MDAPHEHHVVPRLYLTGFSSDSAGKFIYEYSIGDEFYKSPISKPGTRSNSNPQHFSIKRQAGIIPREYSFKDLDGNEIIAGIEPKLARLEAYSKHILPVLQGRRKPVNPWAASPLTGRQKAAFAVYINLMITRTPSGRVLAEKSWQDAPGITAFSEHHQYLKKLVDFLITQRYPLNADYSKALLDFEISRKRAENDAQTIRVSNDDLMWIRQSRGGTVGEFLKYVSIILPEDLPALLRTAHIADNLHFHTKWLRRMRWTYLIAPPNSSFVSSDSPLTRAEGINLRSTAAEVVLPVARNLAIYCSWHIDLPEGYLLAPPGVVGEINRRTIANAQKWVFASRDSQTIVDAIKRRGDPLQLVYDLLRSP
jgi:hypothetical protein